MPDSPISFYPSAGRSVIHFGSPESSKDLVGLGDHSHVLVFRDDQVDLLWTESIRSICDHVGIPTTEVSLPAGESLKQPNQWDSILDHMSAVDLDRFGCVIAAGGGSLGDAVGFAASIWNRGVNWIALPTTLLAMVDAHVGGKTAVHHGGVKNRIGTIHLPKQVWVNPMILETLPRAGLRDGWSELIKAAWIGSTNLLDTLESGIPESLIPSEEVLRQAIAVKVDVVNRDLHEGGLRRILNFGHTLGHALEMELDQGKPRWTHGEAVAMGMVFACHVGNACGVSEENWTDRLANLLTRVGLPLRPAELPSSERIVDRIMRDKKVHAGKVSWVLPESPGRMVIREFERGEIGRLLDSWVAAE